MKVPSNITLAIVQKILAGNLSFGNLASFGSQQSAQNLQGWWAQVTSAAANTDFQVQHNLGYIPSGFLVVNINKAAHVFQGTTPWTNSSIYLQSDQATVTILLFLI